MLFRQPGRFLLPGKQDECQGNGTSEIAGVSAPIAFKIYNYL